MNRRDGERRSQKSHQLLGRGRPVSPCKALQAGGPLGRKISPLLASPMADRQAAPPTASPTQPVQRPAHEWSPVSACAMAHHPATGLARRSGGICARRKNRVASQRASSAARGGVAPLRREVRADDAPNRVLCGRPNLTGQGVRPSRLEKVIIILLSVHTRLTYLSLSLLFCFCFSGVFAAIAHTRLFSRPASPSTMPFRFPAR